METAVTAQFGDGEYLFWLPLPQIIELERLCDTTFLDLHERFEQTLGVHSESGDIAYVGGGPSTNAVLQIIRLALIGGKAGMVDGQDVEVGPMRAKQLLELYAYPARPLAEATALAGSIVMAAVRGVRLKKKADPAATESTSLSEKDSSSRTAELSGSTGRRRRSAPTSKRSKPTTR